MHYFEVLQEYNHRVCLNGSKLEDDICSLQQLVILDDRLDYGVLGLSFACKDTR